VFLGVTTGHRWGYDSVLVLVRKLHLSVPSILNQGIHIAWEALLYEAQGRASCMYERSLLSPLELVSYDLLVSISI
jgi:hypothetical protein